MKCPTHGLELVGSTTRFGRHYACPAAGCTVACWDGPTSTPADQETRRKRHQYHQVFDRLWQERTVFEDRAAAYRWLASVTELSQDDAHFGKFTSEQCDRVLEAIWQLTLKASVEQAQGSQLVDHP